MLSQNHIRGLLQSIEIADVYRLATSFTDLSGNNRTGTNNGANFTYNSANVLGEAVQFRGGQNITFASNLSFVSATANQFTIKAKAKCTNTAGTTEVIFANSISSSNRVGLGFVSSAIIAYYWNGTAYIQKWYPASNNVWYDIEYQNDNGNITLIVNGVTATNNSGLNPNIGSFAKMTIGSGYDNAGANVYFLTGAIEQVQVYNSLNGTNLALDLQFNTTNSTLSDIFYDKSGNGNNATNVGGTWTTDRFGRANRAILLDGVDDYIDLGLANYQGDLSAIVSAKIISASDFDFIIQKGYASTTNYPPNIRQGLRTATQGLQTITFYSSGLSAGNNDMPSVYTNDKWALFYFSFKSGASAHGGAGKQATILNANINTSWATGRTIKVGSRDDGLGLNPNMATDRIMLFNRFLSGHELSKIANRLKIGDLDK